MQHSSHNADVAHNYTMMWKRESYHRDGSLVMLMMALYACADLPVVQDSLLTEPLTSPPPQQPKKKGGARPIVLQPPISLLFDDPAEEVLPGPKEPYIVSGRVAKTRSASCFKVYACSFTRIPMTL